MDIAKLIDHTLLLKPTATHADIDTLCAEALDMGFAAVCVPPCYVAQAHERLRGSEVKTATVIGFPFGYSTTATKLQEIQGALTNGADELDMVHNITAVKNADWTCLEKEMTACLQAVREAGKVIKVIVESGLLTDAELVRCCELYGGMGVDFVKTSTGYAETNATVHAVQLMRRHLPSSVGIKASGGIRSFTAASELILAGATRIGTSAGIAILRESRQQ